jgi:hypothetical protein
MAAVVVDEWRLSPEVIAWGSEQTVRMHTTLPSADLPGAGRCNRCPTDASKCEQLEYARAVLRALTVAAR